MNQKEKDTLFRSIYSNHIKLSKPSNIPSSLPSFNTLEEYLHAPKPTFRHNLLLHETNFTNSDNFNDKDQKPSNFDELFSEFSYKNINELSYIEEYFKKKSENEKNNRKINPENDLTTESGIFEGIQESKFGEKDFSTIQPLPFTKSNEEQCETYSNLTFSEHLEFINLRKRFQGSKKQNNKGKNKHKKKLNWNQKNRFCMMLKKVQLEQEKWFESFKNRMIRNKEKYFYIDKRIWNLIDDINKLKKKKILEKCESKFYKIIDKFEINDVMEFPTTKNNDLFFQVFNANILNLGICRNKFDINLSKSKISFPLNRNLYVFDQKDDSIKEKYFQKRCCPTVSDDLNIKNILKSKNDQSCQIVIAIGTIIKILNNHLKTPNYNPGGKLNDEWVIPIKIEYLNDFKLINFDKPFIKKKITPKEVHQMYFKKALLALLCDRTNNSKSIIFEKDQYHIGNENVNYCAWKFGEFDILLRHKLHCFELKNFSDKGNKIIYNIINSKIEYDELSHFTKSEICKMYYKIKLRPLPENEINFVCGRIDPKNYKLLKLEKVDVKKLGFDHTFSERLLYSVLKKVESYEPGNYILERSGDHIIFRTSSSVPTPCDIQERVEKLGKLENQLVFVPIIWNKKGQIEYTFPPRPRQAKKKKM